MGRKAWLIGILIFFSVLVAAIVAIWLYFSPPITKEQAEQQGEQNVTLTAEAILTGLKNPWDVAFLPDDMLLFNERDGVISKLLNGEKVVIQKIDDVQADGEGGLTGMTVDTDFTNNKYLYTCYNATSGDVRVVRWKLSDDATKLSDKTVLIDNIPSNTSGRHSGCRVKSGKDGTLWVGTGDAAQASNPQNLQSLGGKILRVNRNGEAVAGNIENGDKRIFNYGHRNIQGIALFDEPKDGVYGYSIEHGSSVDDEVNLLVAGNFGWDPLPPYTESVSMTDTNKFPDAIKAIWSSGSSTIAPSGGDVLRGDVWGQYNGALAIAVLKDQHLRMLKFDSDKNNEISYEEPFFSRDFGRIRSATMGPDGLYLTTDNSVDDKIIKVVPQ